MAREDNLLMSDLDAQLNNVLFDDDEGDDFADAPLDSKPADSEPEKREEYEPMPGQLAVDVYETADHLIVKARTAGIGPEDFDVSISDNVLTISGTLNSNDDANVTKWHIQECYWGDFSRTIVLPVAVKEDEIIADLTDGLLRLTFNKIQQEKARKIPVVRVR